MSITFSSDPLPPVVSTWLLCWEDTKLRIASTEVESKSDALAHAALCSECNSYGGPVIEHDRVVNEVNMSNTNAFELLDVLGLSSESFGSLQASDFLGRILLAVAVAPTDPGRPTITEGSVTYCGRNPGYVQKRLAQMRDLAQWCATNNARVTWG
jgi:hypothetical protein